MLSFSGLLLPAAPEISFFPIKKTQTNPLYHRHMYLLRLLQSRTFYYKLYFRSLQHTEQYFFCRFSSVLKIQHFMRAGISCSVQNLARVFMSVKPWHCSSKQNLFRKHMKMYRNSSKESGTLTPNMLNNHCKAALTSRRTFCARPQGE